MDFTSYQNDAISGKMGLGIYSLEEDDNILIQVAGETVVNETCPAGKKWFVRITIDIIETDA